MEVACSYPLGPFLCLATSGVVSIFYLAWVELITIEEDTELLLFLQSIVTTVDKHGVARINKQSSSPRG